MKQTVGYTTKALLGLMAFAMCQVVLAQETPKRCIDPASKTIFTFTITIEGSESDVRQVKGIGFSFTRSSPATLVPGQERFSDNFGSQSAMPKAKPGVFEVSMVVPEYTADGNYTISQISVDNGVIAEPTFRPPDFTPPDPITVCNPKRFGPLKIKSVVKNP